MSTLTLKNFPPDLHKELKERARRHRRSLNKEVIHCLESVLETQPLDPERYLERIRPIRDRTARIDLSADALCDFKDEGRP